MFLVVFVVLVVTSNVIFFFFPFFVLCVCLCCVCPFFSLVVSLMRDIFCPLFEILRDDMRIFSREEKELLMMIL